MLESTTHTRKTVQLIHTHTPDRSFRATTVQYSGEAQHGTATHLKEMQKPAYVHVYLHLVTDRYGSHLNIRTETMCLDEVIVRQANNERARGEVYQS